MPIQEVEIPLANALKPYECFEMLNLGEILEVGCKHGRPCFVVGGETRGNTKRTFYCCRKDETPSFPLEVIPIGEFNTEGGVGYFIYEQVE